MNQDAETRLVESTSPEMGWPTLDSNDKSEEGASLDLTNNVKDKSKAKAKTKPNHKPKSQTKPKMEITPKPKDTSKRPRSPYKECAFDLCE